MSTIVLKAGMLEPVLIVLGALQNEKMPAKTAYRLLRIHRKISGEVKTFNEAKNTLLTKYGTKNEEGSQGQQIAWDLGDNQEVFYKEMNEIANSDVEITGQNRVPFSMFEEMDLTIQQLEVLSRIIDEDDFADETSDTPT